MNIPRDKLIYVDESGLDKPVYREYGRNTIGSKVYADITGKRFNRTSIISGYSATLKILIAPYIYEGYTDTNFFNCWIEQKLVPELTKGQVIIIDNASFHKSERAINLVEQASCKIIFLPPYSPDLNPIEQQWSILKQRLRNNPKHQERFLDTLIEEINYMSRI